MEPVTIDGRTFASAMEQHWTETLGNVCNKHLRKLWEITGESYVQAIYDTSDLDPYGKDFVARWRVLQPPTGTGKSQGAAVYAALLALANRGNDNPTCVLIVVRQKKQCEELCGAVQAYLEKHNGNPSACNYHHTDHTLSVEERWSSIVLVCTHSAYVNAAAAHGMTPDRFESFTLFGSNPFDSRRRYLTIIDEALGSVVETSQVTHDWLHRILQCLDPVDRLRAEYRREVECIKTMQSILEIALSDDLKTPDTVYRDLDRYFSSLPDPQDLRLFDFWKELRKRDLAAKIQAGRTSLEDRNRYRTHFAQTFNAMNICLQQWRFYAKEQRKASINTSSFVIPDNLVAPVCLDATASNNYLWELLGNETAEIINTPVKARSYKGVTMKVALQSKRGSGLGKGSMINRATHRSRRLVAHLEKHVDSDALIVCHKRLKPALMKFLQVAPEAPLKGDIPEWFHLSNGAKVHLANWWALDGLNDYRHCEHVVLFGLPYMDDVWALNMVFALQGYKPDLLRSPEFKTHADYRKHLEYQQMTLMIIQAINRGRCRNVVNERGGCLPMTIWFPLPGRLEGDDVVYRNETEAIVEGCLSDMPGLSIEPWSYDVDAADDRLHRSRNGKDTAPYALLAYVDNAHMGEIKFSSIQRDLSFTKWTIKRLREDIAKQFARRKGTLYEALASRGVEYSGGRGKAAVLTKAFIK